MNLTWKWFAQTLWMRRTAVLAAAGLTFLTFCSGIAFPVLTQRAVDAVISRNDIREFGAYLLMAAVFLIVEAWLTHLRQVSLVNLGTFLDRRLSNLCFFYMMRLRTDRKIASGGNVSVYFQHLSKIRNFLLGVLPRTTIDAGGAIIALVIMCAYSWPVAACAVAILIVSALDMKRQLPKVYAASAAQFKADGKRLEFFIESYNGLDTVKTLTTEGRRYRRWQSLTDDFLKRVADSNIIGQKIGLSALAWSRISSLAIIAIGCYQISQNTITVGDLIALQLLSFRLQIPVATLGDIVRQYEEAGIALAAVRQFLLAGRESAQTSRGVSSLATPCPLEFRDVSLTYRSSDKPAIRNISFRTPETGLVALVGRNGAGKTTLLNILLGHQRDYSGSVTLSGIEIRNFNPRYLRSRIGVAAQDATLFAGTLRTNLDVGLFLRDEQEMAVALAQAEATSLLGGVGLDREIQESGRNLSGGQRQRTAVARSLIGAPPILVLDEPTAFLDAEAANRLDKALVNLAADRLLLMVSHNLSATRNAGLIVVLHEGTIAGVGCHDDLLVSCREYKTLWENHLENR